jgi:hypothetical protein
MKNHRVRFTKTGVKIRSANSSGGVEVYRTPDYCQVGGPGFEPYSTWPQAISHLAKMMDAADRLLDSHPGPEHASQEWMTWEAARELTRRTAA